MYQTPKDETLHRLCHKSTDELASVFCSCPGRETYSRSLKSLVRDLAEEHQLRERSTLVARLQSWITEAQTGKSPGTRFLKRVKDVKLLPFGSSVMGISNRDGDLDISLEGAIRDRTISPTGKLSDAARGFKADLLGEIHEVLRRGQHFRHSKHTQLIRHAKVPVSKFVEPHTGIHCDLSIGNTTGVFKSMLLAEVLRMDTRVRDLVVIVKKWAKANRINDPANGSFNSYCLTLLVVSFAQARSPPLIPPFRELFPGLRDVVCESQKDDHVDLIHEISTFRHMASKWMEQTNGTRNTETLCELLCAFFLELSLFATHSQLLHYTAEGVSKSNSRPTCSCWDSGFVLSAWDAKALKRYQLFVEDPFEAKDNCARTLATQDWWRIVKTLQETVNLVQEFVYAPPALQPEKWMVLWSFLFQYEPLPQLPEAMEGAEYAIQRPKSLMPLHKECLIEHLNKFKASDKKFIAVSYSWWSKEFKQFVLNAIDSLGLFQGIAIESISLEKRPDRSVCLGKGPKKKVIISKADNIKDDMVEHAVNSTLRARKAHNLVVEPYQCVMKQRLAEFLRCTIRYHKFRASYFDDETKDWLLRCVLEAGLKGKYVDGDLHLERPADLRPISLEENGVLSGQRKELPLVSGSPIEDFSVVGHLEIEEHGTARQETKLASYSPEEEEDLEEEDPWGDVNGTETCASSYGELGTSYETSYIHRYVQSPSCDSVKVQMDVTSDGYVKLNCIVLKLPPKKQTPRRSKSEELDLTAFGKEESVKVSLTTTDGYVSLRLEPSGGSCMSRGLLSELTTVAEEESRDEDTGRSHHTLLSNGLYERNAEILKRVFLDLFDAMEKLQDTDSFRGEIEIDPTEYVVPVSWVRQQVRDIARHLFLEIVANNKRRRAMKIRIRKRARCDIS